MVYFWSAILVAVNSLFLLLVFFGLPGNWLMVISTCLFAWWQVGHGVFSTYTLAVITALAVLGELIEFLAGLTGARAAGASWFASMAALLGAVTGAVLGTILIPVVFIGTILGACAGAAVMTAGTELIAGKKIKTAVCSGTGAGVGALAGLTAKIAVGGLIWLIVAVTAFWP